MVHDRGYRFSIRSEPRGTVVESRPGTGKAHVVHIAVDGEEMAGTQPRPIRVALVAAAVFGALGLVITLEPMWWGRWGSLVATLTTAAATTVLVVVTNRYVALTDRLASQAERQAALATLPVMAISSRGREGVVILKNRGAPALNVEYRVLTNDDGQIAAASDWQWVQAVMADGDTGRKMERPRSSPVHAQVRFLDSLGTTFLVERRYLGGSAVGAYRVFRLREQGWEHISLGASRQIPLEPTSALPRRLDDEREED